MKNPYGVEPTPFMKRKDSQYAIECNPYYGPIFGYYGSDIFIDDNCNEENSCHIDNDGTNTYECHPEYQSSLFVGHTGPKKLNYFTVLDYEVFAIDYDSKYTIDHICKYPDIIWKYMETNDISEESLKQFDDDIELLNDLDAIHCDDSDIRLKISCCLKNPSEFLPDTQIINQQYDAKLREWIGNDYQWRLIYRASEHEYTASSFHECCNDVKGPTLVIIKSSRGWIFGGYTTQSWKVVHPDEDGCIL